MPYYGNCYQCGGPCANAAPGSSGLCGCCSKVQDEKRAQHYFAHMIVYGPKNVKVPILLHRRIKQLWDAYEAKWRELQALAVAQGLK